MILLNVLDTQHPRLCSGRASVIELLWEERSEGQQLKALQCIGSYDTADQARSGHMAQFLA